MAPELAAGLAEALPEEVEDAVILVRLVYTGFFTTCRGGSPTIYQNA